LGGSQAVQLNGVNFGTFCNFIINGKDIGQNFAPTFQDCMGQCAGTTGCNAVSYDASMNQGFKNCYMKTGASASDNIIGQGIDTAVVQNNAAVVESAPASSAAPAPSPATTTVIQATTVIPEPVTVSPTAVSAAPVSVTPVSAAPVSASPATTLVPLTQQPVAATTGGASFFTPPGAGSATTARGAAPPVSVATETVVSIITSVSVSDAVSITELITIPVTTEISATGIPPSSAAEESNLSSTTAAAEPSAAQLGGPSQPPGPASSRAWIAAPVVGSIAALVVVVVVFVMLGRRRLARSSRPGTAGTAGSMESGASGGGLFTAWLPGSPRFRNRILGGAGLDGVSGGGMGNFSSVTGKAVVPPPQPVTVAMRGSGRSSIFGGGILGGAKGERLKDAEGGSDAFGSRERRSGQTNRGITPVYEVRNGKMELRESLDGMNGLSQNRWSER
jgi:hypothetical protein